MIKIILFSILGRKLVAPRLLFNMVKTYLIFYLMVLPGFMQAQEFEWLKTKPENFQFNPELLGSAVVYDNQENIYWMGLADYTDNWSGLAYGNLFVHKYSTGGDSLEFNQYQGLAAILEAEASLNGELFMLVSIRDDLIINETIIPFTGTSTQTYLIKLMVNGEVDWYKSIWDGPGFQSTTFAVGLEGNLYVGSSDFINSQVSVYSDEGLFVSELIQENVQLISSVDVDNENNIYVAGSCANADGAFNGVSMDPGFFYNYYVAKYNALYELQWVKFVEDVTCSFPMVVCHNPENVYFSGPLNFATLFDDIQANGPNWVFDFFVSRLNSNGDFMWVNEGPDDVIITGDAGIGSRSFCNVDEENNVYVSGFIRGNLDWGNEIQSNSTNMGYDLLALKYDEEGEMMYAHSGGGELYDQALSSSTDPSGNFYVAGFGSENTVFGSLVASGEGVYHILTKISAEELISSFSPPQNHIESPLKLFPNPTTDYFSIKGNFSAMDVSSMNIYSNQGTLIVKHKDPIELRFFIGDIPSGIYFVEVVFHDLETKRTKLLIR